MALYVDAVTFEETLFEGTEHGTLEDATEFSRHLAEFFAALPADEMR
jgi:hypothetical protein